ncbi:MAG: UDP-N-acetylglucosamine 2-epimerase [Candidatus Peregrinibacteria bacterium Gr01-1014_25]|nr:MAG: UDP-N-acetylglucosamine 2-epimerase [Candidatus Peregrinibacteria bacterium Gr01-1014_25]
MPRKICVVITSHIHYTRTRLVLRELQARPDVSLQIAVGASAILPQYGDALSAMAEDKFTYDAKITMTLAGGTPVAMAKTTGIGVTEFATAFENLQPDLVVVRGDRYEVLSAAVAAAYMNIPVAHIEGGDITGSIDESVRHAVTKLSHIHFATNAASAKRIIRMGEDPRYVFDVGAPEIEQLEAHTGSITSEQINRHGVGADLDLQKPYILVIHHPVTTEPEQNRAHTAMLLDALSQNGLQVIWFWPNVDAGTDEVSKAIRVFREHNDPRSMRFAKYLPTQEFLSLLKGCACIVGNSSSGIKEASFLGVPAVNVGTRQAGRLRADNVIDVPYDATQLRDAITRQSAIGRYPRSDLYYKPKSSKTIANILATTDLYVQKRFHVDSDE